MQKVFATGLSRGGFFCQRIASELTHKFSAVASVGGTLPDSVAHYHARRDRIGVMIVHGTNDLVVDYKGKANSYYSAADTYAYWKKVNDVSKVQSQSFIVDKNKADGTRVEILESGSKGKVVALLTIVDGGHTWPGKDEFNIGLPIGRTSAEIDLNEYIWSFFERQHE